MTERRGMCKPDLRNLALTIPYIEKALQSGKQANVVISGCSCSGKTTLASEIEEYYKRKHSVCILHQDDYFKDLKDWVTNEDGVLGDHIDSFHTKEFVDAVKTLCLLGNIQVPVYDFATNTRTNKWVTRERGEINIIEGLHAVRLLKDVISCVTVYLDVSYDECLKRRIKRDFENWQVPGDAVREYWVRCILPSTKECVEPQKEMSLLVL